MSQPEVELIFDFISSQSLFQETFDGKDGKPQGMTSGNSESQS